DSYQARILLTDGYPSDRYELSLTIYDADTDTVLQNYDNYDDSRLGDLYLEDSSRESAATNSLSIYEMSFELNGD
ncbi:MAG: hypothetical protein GWO08_09955, partial [Gammaproteobacteria bacterium]|nr:hypothetical protein [Gammaproteobacteria bacterium]NIR93977.1 hypothetical protein [Gammaproteobacteria bacterium]